MTKELPKLKLGKGNAFVKSQLRRLRQEDETWEADFRALPKATTQTAMHYLGMVVMQPDGFYLISNRYEPDSASMFDSSVNSARSTSRWA